MRVRYRTRAEADLEAIVSFSVERWGTEQAERYASAIVAAIKRLCDFPLSGPPAEMVSKGLRRLRSGSHHVFYRVAGDDIVIVRILHIRRDPTLHFR